MEKDKLGRLLVLWLLIGALVFMGKNVLQLALFWLYAVCTSVHVMRVHWRGFCTDRVRVACVTFCVVMTLATAARLVFMIGRGYPLL